MTGSTSRSTWSRVAPRLVRSADCCTGLGSAGVAATEGGHPGPVAAAPGTSVPQPVPAPGRGRGRVGGDSVAGVTTESEAPGALGARVARGSEGKCRAGGGGRGQSLRAEPGATRAGPASCVRDYCGSVSMILSLRRIKARPTDPPPGLALGAPRPNCSPGRGGPGKASGRSPYYCKGTCARRGPRSSVVDLVHPQHGPVLVPSYVIQATNSGIRRPHVIRQRGPRRASLRLRHEVVGGKASTLIGTPRRSYSLVGEGTAAGAWPCGRA